MIKLCWWYIYYSRKKISPAENKTIIFVKSFARYRVLKQALGLRYTKIYKLILVTQKCNPELLEDVFDEVIFYKTRLGLALLLKKLNPYLVHAQSPSNRDVVLAIKYANCPVIGDSYDITSVSYKNPPKKELTAEKLWYEHVDGIIYRDPAIDFMKRKYNVNCPVLHFLDYSPKRFIVENPLPKLSKTQGGIHIVYVGQVFPMELPKSTHGRSQFGEIAEAITVQNIHFHLYVDPNLHKLYSYSYYEDLEEKNPYFHFHSGLPVYQLNEEISKYDYGWWVLNHSEDTSVPEIKKAVDIPNKFFNYLEAGLPIIVGSIFKYSVSLVEEYNIGIVCDVKKLHELGTILKQVDHEKLLDNVLKARQILSMENQVHRLVSFYEEVVGNYYRNLKSITEKGQR